MSNTINLQNILHQTKDRIPKWAFSTKFKKNGEWIETPNKVWQNLKVILDENGTEVRYNLISKEVEIFGFKELSQERNGKLTDIYTFQVNKGLKMSRPEVSAALSRIAEFNSYNPFLEHVKKHRNSNYGLIQKVFDVIPINPHFEEHREFFKKLFMKWCFNVITINHNTLKNQYRTNGVLILQGKQGGRKSTFFSKLMPVYDNDFGNCFFKGDFSLTPDKVDSIMQNTKYTLVEWGELDSTLKGEQAKLKQFITATSDEYRSPYAQFSEVHPRLTTFCGSVNKLGFLKDETGSRRFWVIPMDETKKVDIEAMDKIDISEFWGAIYDMWKSEEDNGYHVISQNYLNQDEEAILATVNRNFDAETDISITLDDYLDWGSDPNTWIPYKTSEIALAFSIHNKKLVLNEMERRGIPNKVYKMKNGKTKRGYKLPPMPEIDDIYYRSEG